jgi:HPt (histidine-containing phosphotransfer) domain-containing protein
MTICEAGKELYYSKLAEEPELMELVELFVNELPARLEQLAWACTSHDWPEVARLAHQLKGAGGSHGFAQLTPYAWKLEQAARDGRPEGEVAAALERLIAVCGRVRAGLPQ